MSTYAGRPAALTDDTTRRVALQTLAGLLVAAGVIAVTVYITHRPTLSGVAAAVVVLGSVWFATTRHTQLALALWMLYIGLLDGYLKLASGSEVVTFVRDVLLFAIVVGLLVRATIQGKRLPLPPLSGWVIAFIVVVLIQIPNPSGGSLVHSLAGVRQHLEFVPLFFLMFAFVRTTKALRVFVILLAVIATANGVAGLVQFNETPQQFASWGPGYSQRVLGTGSFVGGRTFATTTGGAGTRPFGLGSDAGEGGLFGALAFGGILALASLYRRRRYLVIGVVMTAGATLAIVTSQGRGVIIAAVIAVLAFAMLTTTSRNRITNLIGFALAIAVAAFIVQAIVGSVGSSGVRYQGLSPSSIVQTTNTARGRSIALIPHNLITYPFGAGLATAGPASTAPGATALTGNVDAETEFSFLTLETGIPGVLVLTGFTITLLVLGARRCRQEPDREARTLLAALIAPLAAIFALYFVSTTSASVPIAPYLWAVAGIVSYWLVALPAQRRRESAIAAKAPARARLIAAPVAR